jgi:hypothetical protein
MGNLAEEGRLAAQAPIHRAWTRDLREAVAAHLIPLGRQRRTRCWPRPRTGNRSLCEARGVRSDCA